jgi:DNA processing protein
LRTHNNTTIYHKLSLLYRPGSTHLTELIDLYDGRLSELVDITIRDPKNPILHLNENERVHAALFSDEKYSEIVEECGKNNISIIDIHDEFYPPLLREIYNPPVLLYAAGDKSALLSGLSLAVVGARDPSDYSRQITVKLIRALQKSEVKWTIVSGFARGIDITAHTTAVKYGAKTVAVKGCGILYNYPKQNELFADVIKKNGVIISEYPPFEAAKSMYFPVRNRIIAGMSAGTLIIEASDKSGSLVTANLAAEFGRDVFCIPPHDITQTRYFGNVGLLRDGASPLYGLRDLIFENVNTTLFVAEKFSDNENSESKTPVKKVHKPKPAAEKLSNNRRDKLHTLTADKLIESAEFHVTTADRLIEEEELLDTVSLEGGAKIIAEKILMSESGLSAEDISNETDLDVLDIIDILTDLEISGFIRKNADGRFTKG